MVSHKVGYDMPTGCPPTSTGPASYSIPEYIAENVISAGPTLGTTKSTHPNDLLHMHIEQDEQQNKTFCRIGFDVGPEGSARGEWHKIGNEIKYTSKVGMDVSPHL